MWQTLFAESWRASKVRIGVFLMIAGVGGGIGWISGNLWVCVFLLMLGPVLIIAYDFFAVRRRLVRASKYGPGKKKALACLSKESSPQFKLRATFGLFVVLGLLFVTAYLAAKTHREAFRRDVYVHNVEGHWIHRGENLYEHAIVASILNKNNLRAYLIPSASFTGSFELGGPGGAFGLSEIMVGKPDTTLTGSGHGRSGPYYLRPGRETKIKLLLGTLTKMNLISGVPGLTYVGTWTFHIEGEIFTFVSTSRTTRVMLPVEWEELQ